MKAKQDELKNHIEAVDQNTADINKTTATLKDRTDELAAKQDEILNQILKLAQGNGVVMS